VDASLPNSDQADGIHAQGEGLTFAQLPRRTQIAILLTVLAVLLFLILMPPLPQDQSYHSFADRRTLSAFPLSGHTLKHLLAGIGNWYVVPWLQRTESGGRSTAASG